MSQVPLVAANLATVPIQSLFYGVFLLLFVTSTYTFVHRAQRDISGMRTVWGKPLFLASVGMFITITGQWILTVVRAFDAFVHYQGGTAPLAFYSDLAETTKLVSLSLSDATLIIGGAVLIYRLWVIWNYRKRVIVLPLLIYAASIVGIVASICEYSRYQTDDDTTIFTHVFGRWVTVSAILDLINNVGCSALIAWRLWRSHIRTAPHQHGGGNMMRVLAVFVESAALYVTWTIFFVVSYESGSNIQYTAFDTWPSISGIAFMLINVHAGFGLARQSQNRTSYFPPHYSYNRGDTDSALPTYAVPMRTIEIMREVHVHGSRSSVFSETLEKDPGRMVLRTQEPTAIV